MTCSDVDIRVLCCFVADIHICVVHFLVCVVDLIVLLLPFVFVYQFVRFVVGNYVLKNIGC